MTTRAYPMEGNITERLVAASAVAVRTAVRRTLEPACPRKVRKFRGVHGELIATWRRCNTALRSALETDQARYKKACDIACALAHELDLLDRGSACPLDSGLAWIPVSTSAVSQAVALVDA